jgi:putative transposase
LGAHAGLRNGTVDQELLARNEYLAAENRIMKAQLKGRLMLSDAERGVLGEIGYRLGRKVLADVASVARPDTILSLYRKLIARKFDGSKARNGPGRPRIKREVEVLIVRVASENRDWGYDRIAGALANLGYEISDQTVGNVLRRHGPPPAPERKRTTTWAAFIRTHVALLAGTDFFTAEMLTLRGLATYYVLFFIHLESRRVDIAGITAHPDEPWMKQIARNVTMDDCGALRDCRYLLHDRDTKFTRSFRAILMSGVESLALPACSPNLNAYAERWVRSIKEGVLVQGDPVRRALLAAGAEQLCRSFPCRAESPGEGQRPAVSSGYGPLPRGACAVPRAIGWAPALLPSRGGVKVRPLPTEALRRFNFLTIRHCRRRSRISERPLATATVATLATLEQSAWAGPSLPVHDGPCPSSPLPRTLTHQQPSRRQPGRLL